MTTMFTERDVFRSQVRYPITPADPVIPTRENTQICIPVYAFYGQ